MIRALCSLLFAVMVSAAPVLAGDNAPGHVYSAGVDCDDRPSVADKMHCEQLRLDTAQERLDRVGAELAAALPENLRRKFLDSQAAWLAFRDAHFDFAASMLSKNGPEGLWLQVKNSRLMTEKRVLELEALLDAASDAEPDAQGIEPESSPPSRRTAIHSGREADMLMGSHGLRLQWIGEDPTGRAVIRDRDGLLVLEGEQSRGGDTLRMHGVVVEVRDRAFVLEGTVVTEVHHVAGGRPCVRTGEFLFLRREGRPFWRMQDIDNPCADVVDYIDIFP